MEKIKNYQKPTMRVVELQQRYHLLEDSPNPGGPDGGSRSASSDWDKED